MTQRGVPLFFLPFATILFMFTGLIREIATVAHFSGETLGLKARYRPGIGDSVAVNGACLTVTRLMPDGFAVELSHESQEVLATENYRDRVHIEPAMRLSDRLEGHILQGHIDCIGTLVSVDKKGRSWDYRVQIPAPQRRYIIPKGSVAIDGVSLTVNDVDDEGFRLTLIPHTLKETLLEGYRPGQRINIETDMFARYLFHLFSKGSPAGKGWDAIDKILSIY